MNSMLGLALLCFCFCAPNPCDTLPAQGIVSNSTEEEFIDGIESEDLNKIDILPEEDDGRTIDEVIRDAGTAEEGAALAAEKNQQINFDMDMNLDSLQYKFLYSDATPQGQLRAGAGLKNPFFRWPKAIIPYKISSQFGNKHVNVIAGAMKEWQENTCIRFTPAGSVLANSTGHRHRITIVSKYGCYSSVGYRHRNYEVSLRIGGCTHHQIASHEFGHTIGLHHEQSRTDRDTALKIILDNAWRGTHDNFDVQKQTHAFGVPYDYCSIMHYGGKAFTSNGNFTILTRNQDYQGRIGSQTVLRFTDTKIVNIMYNCSAHCPKDNACKEPCYLNHLCNCTCPTPCPKKPCTAKYKLSECSGAKRSLGELLITGEFGNGCGKSGCGDMDKCSSNPCDINAKCNNTNRSYICTCNNGFVGNGKLCTFIEIDECALGIDNCDKNAICTDTRASFICKCMIGFIGDGTTCEVLPCQAFQTTADADANFRYETLDNHCYLFSKTEKTWTAARNFCKEKGGDLVAIDNEAENAFVHDTFHGDMDVADYISIGAFYDKGLGWHWVANNERLNFSNWARSYADGAPSGVGKYAAMYPYKETWGAWGDYSEPFVCEEKSGNESTPFSHNHD